MKKSRFVFLELVEKSRIILPYYCINQGRICVTSISRQIQGKEAINQSVLILKKALHVQKHFVQNNDSDVSRLSNFLYKPSKKIPKFWIKFNEEEIILKREAIPTMLLKYFIRIVAKRNMVYLITSKRYYVTTAKGFRNKHGVKLSAFNLDKPMNGWVYVKIIVAYLKWSDFKAQKGGIKAYLKQKKHTLLKWKETLNYFQLESDEING